MNIKRVTTLDLAELEMYTKCNEPQLLHYFEPDRGIFIAETPSVIELALRSGCVPLSFFVEERILETSVIESLLQLAIETIDDIPVYTAPLNVINGITGYNLTRGVLCAMRRPEMPRLEQVISGAKHIMLLEDVENPTNVGALFRSAAALGADCVILTDDCSDPLYRRTARVSMGTVFKLPWIKTSSDTLISDLKSNGFTIISFALNESAISINDKVLDNIEKSVVIFGNESTGISESTLSQSDYIVTIPMKNGVDSLNVAAASAVAFYRLFE